MAYLAELIEEPINKLLEETFKGKKVTINDFQIGVVTFTCKDVNFSTDDGNVFLSFEDTEGNDYTADGQGLDIWYEVEEEGGSNE